jgi:hypothetical protein
MIAIAIAFVANYPFLTVVFLLFIGPLLIRTAVAPYVSTLARQHVYWIVAVLQACYSIGCGLCLLRLIPPSIPDWRVYTWLGLLSGTAIVCACLAWAQSNATSASKRGEAGAVDRRDDSPAI